MQNLIFLKKIKAETVSLAEQWVAIFSSRMLRKSYQGASLVLAVTMTVVACGKNDSSSSHSQPTPPQEASQPNHTVNPGDQSSNQNGSHPQVNPVHSQNDPQSPQQNRFLKNLNPNPTNVNSGGLNIGTNTSPAPWPPQNSSAPQPPKTENETQKKETAPNASQATSELLKPWLAKEKNITSADIEKLIQLSKGDGEAEKAIQNADARLKSVGKDLRTWFKVCTKQKEVHGLTRSDIVIINPEVFTSPLSETRKQTIRERITSNAQKSHYVLSGIHEDVDNFIFGTGTDLVEGCLSGDVNVLDAYEALVHESVHIGARDEEAHLFNFLNKYSSFSAYFLKNIIGGKGGEYEAFRTGLAARIRLVKSIDQRVLSFVGPGTFDKTGRILKPDALKAQIAGVDVYIDGSREAQCVQDSRCTKAAEGGARESYHKTIIVNYNNLVTFTSALGKMVIEELQDDIRRKVSSSPLHVRAVNRVKELQQLQAAYVNRMRAENIPVKFEK